VLTAAGRSGVAPARLLLATPGRQQTRQRARLETRRAVRVALHGRWLNMAESELSVLSDQCLDRRIPDKQTLTEEVAALEDSRNKKCVKADWQFSTADARVKLKRLYPAM
jgi:hypothetical protein